MVIVEGPDGSGKSMLVQQILNTFDHAVKPGIKATANRSKLYETTVEDTMLALGRCACTVNGPVEVFDRLFFSEFVYPEFQDRECQFSQAQRDWVVDLLQVMRVPVILCMPDLDTVLHNVRDTEQHSWVGDNAHHIYLHYQVQCRTWYPFTTLVYDYTTGRRDLPLERVEHFINQKKERSW